MSAGCAATTAGPRPCAAGASSTSAPASRAMSTPARVVPRREVELPVGVDVPGGDVAQVERPPCRRGGCRACGRAPRRRRRPGARAGRRRTRSRSRPAPSRGPVGSRAWIGRSSQTAPQPATARYRRPALESRTTPTRGLAVDLDGDRDGVGGIAVDVVGGAVERVDDPAHPARALPGGALLAEQRVVGARGAQPSTIRRSASLVDLADEVGGRRLGLDAQRVVAGPRVDAPRPRARGRSRGRAARAGRAGRRRTGRGRRSCELPRTGSWPGGGGGARGARSAARRR